VSDLSDLKKFLDDAYRAAYLDLHVKASIAYQIQELRHSLRMTQTQFGQSVGMTQAVISRLEDAEGGSVNVNTLLKIANGRKIGLRIKFCNFETILKEDISPAGLEVETIEKTIHRLTPSVQRTKNIAVTVHGANWPNVQGSRPWQTDLKTNQPATSAPLIFPGSGILNFARSTPMEVSPG
jgi:transcriptional regulator with XRE-family HTH domain